MGTRFAKDDNLYRINCGFQSPEIPARFRQMNASAHSEMCGLPFSLCNLFRE